MKKERQYFLVDDDATSNLICELNIKRIDPLAAISSFNDPEEALYFIKKNCLPENRECVLFLDINMPSMTGWEFLDAFENFCPEIKRKIRIYILTSAIEEFSGEKKKYPYVSGFFSKPIMSKNLIRVLEDIGATGVQEEKKFYLR
ncbi:Response regulator receiver domain-containing protein [Salinimicrobium catena]|uniref:Response regulator receiver domain-containing protein n=1 Tax=Salinimicrobium catena TaxID=390640 RepID=A0A1H5L0I1_9FLAO|nr:response regulator [Salinimicrobium catena]SDL04082.1 Response regulator receiver domain-containing protein [Salinimicrobium catena]SEE70460.1 Response regulator receiver domain-containing protein [Salinimicrobium catena]